MKFEIGDLVYSDWRDSLVVVISVSKSGNYYDVLTVANKKEDRFCLYQKGSISMEPVESLSPFNMAIHGKYLLPPDSELPADGKPGSHPGSASQVG